MKNQKEICAYYVVNTETGLTVGTNVQGEKIIKSFQKNKIENPPNEFVQWLKKHLFTPTNIRVIPISADAPSLLQVQLDLTWNCNLSCSHCYLKDKSLIAPPLSMKDWLNIVDQLYELQVPKITLLGGEPTLSPFFYEVANYSSKKGFKLYTTTNGTLITKDIAKKIYDSGFTEIDISLDGATAKTHEFIRGKNTFKRTLNGAKLLSQEGLKVKTATVLSKINFCELEELANLGSKIGVTEMYFNNLLPGGNGKNIWEKEKLTTKEWKRVSSVAKEWNEKKQAPRLFIERMFDFAHIETKTKNNNLIEHDITQGGCKAGKREVIISPDGFLVICPLVSTDRSFHKTNVRDVNIADAWKHDPWVNRLRKIDESCLEGECKDCQHKTLCKGGCHLLSLFEKDSLCKPDPRCPYTTSNTV